jgi:hypothetical protein
VRSRLLQSHVRGARLRHHTTGAPPFDELFDLLRAGRVDLELETDLPGRELRRRRLELSHSNDWSQPYCSQRRAGAATDVLCGRTGENRVSEPAKYLPATRLGPGARSGARPAPPPEGR